MSPSHPPIWFLRVIKPYSAVAALLPALVGPTAARAQLMIWFDGGPQILDGGAGDKLLVTSEDGLTYILRAADHYEELARNDLGEYTLATPAILGGRIYFRTASNLICVGEE